MRKLFFTSWILTACAAIAPGQAPYAAPAGADPLGTMTVEIQKISASVTSLARSFKAFVDKMEKAGAVALTDKQQKLLFGMELLARAEARLAVLQKNQIELSEKLNETRAKLAQNDVESRPRSIDRSVQFVGTTETQELRDNRIAKLASEKATLTASIQQLMTSLAENDDALREAQSIARKLRKTYIPQVERELAEQ